MIRSWWIAAAERLHAAVSAGKRSDPYAWQSAVKWALFRLAAVRPRVHLTRGTTGQIAWLRVVRQSNRYREVRNAQ